MYFTAYPYDHRIHRDMKSGEHPFKQIIHTLYDHPNKEALYAICDTSLEEARWEEQCSYHNEGAIDASITAELTTPLEVVEGIDMDRAFQIAAGFLGTTMEIGGTTKTFSHAETRRPVTHRIEIPVEAGQTTYFYQRKYKLKTRVWFMLDAWGQAWVVGRYAISEPWTRTVLTEVMSNEFVRRSCRLEGEGEIPPARVPEFRKVARGMSIKKFEDCTERCHEALRKYGA